jgi:hypothetical protein
MHRSLNPVNHLVIACLRVALLGGLNVVISEAHDYA